MFDYALNDITNQIKHHYDEASKLQSRYMTYEMEWTDITKEQSYRFHMQTAYELEMLCYKTGLQPLSSEASIH